MTWRHVRNRLDDFELHSSNFIVVVEVVNFIKKKSKILYFVTNDIVEIHCIDRDKMKIFSKFVFLISL